MRLPSKSAAIITKEQIEKIAKEVGVHHLDISIDNAIIVYEGENAFQIFERWVDNTLNVSSFYDTNSNAMFVFHENEDAEVEANAVIEYIKDNFKYANELVFETIIEGSEIIIKFELPGYTPDLKEDYPWFL